MSIDLYNNGLQTPETLAAQVDSLPPNLVLVGSIGRCVLMGLLKPLHKSDGSVTDIDVVDVTGKERELQTIDSGPFCVDALLTRIVRPYEDGARWGLFLDGQEEPYTTLDAELCQPTRLQIPWSPEHTASVLPVGIQAALIDIKSPYRKNRTHIQQFQAFATEQDSLPPEVQKQIADFKVVNWQYERTHHHGKPLSKTAQAYKQAKRVYNERCPGPVRRVVESALGDTIRKVRRATIEL